MRLVTARSPFLALTSFRRRFETRAWLTANECCRLSRTSRIRQPLRKSADHLEEALELFQGQARELTRRMRILPRGGVQLLAAGSQRMSHPSGDLDEWDPSREKSGRERVTRVVEGEVGARCQLSWLPHIALEVALAPAVSAGRWIEPSLDVGGPSLEYAHQLAGNSVHRPRRSRSRT